MKRKILSLIFFIAACNYISFGQYVKYLDLNDTTGTAPYYAGFCQVGDYLYSPTTNFGNNNDGTIFKIKTDGSGFLKIFDFAMDETGSQALSAVISDGIYLYGTAKLGGPLGFGTIYRLKTDGSDFEILHSFTGGDDGRDPAGSLFFDGTYLYGHATIGGLYGKGTLYKLKPDGTSFSVIFDFDHLTTGGECEGSVIQIDDYLYGFATQGGIYNQGLLYKIKPDGTNFEILMDLQDDPNGSYASGTPVYDGTYLYGMTKGGGEYNYGTLFKILTDGSGYEKLHDFNIADGYQPLGSLIVVGSTIYGLTELGGTGFYGTMFKIENDGSDYTALINFDGDNGSLPFGTLHYAAGAFFGMTNEGGTSNQGVIFRYGDIIEGINNPQSISAYVYPNPTSDFMHINISSNDLSQPVPFALYNIVGTCFFSGMIDQSGIIHTENLPAGIYFITTTSESGVSTCKIEKR